MDGREEELALKLLLTLQAAQSKCVGAGTAQVLYITPMVLCMTL